MKIAGRKVAKFHGLYQLDGPKRLVGFGVCGRSRLAYDIYVAGINSAIAVSSKEIKNNFRLFSSA